MIKAGFSMNKKIPEIEMISSEIQELKHELSNISNDLSELKVMLLNKWKSEDERYGEYRWPYDIDGDLLKNVSLTIPEVN